MAHNLDIAMPIGIDEDGKEINATPYFEDYLHDIIFSLGGEGAEPVPINEISQVDFHTTSARLKTLSRRVGELENESGPHRLDSTVKQIEIDTMNFVAKVKITNYTAINKDWVEARSGATIKAPSNPLANDQFIVSNGDGSTITVLGNGNDIKYTKTDTKILTRKKGTSLHFQLFEDSTTKYWRIR